MEAAKIDLSVRPRIDDHDLGKGRSTPKKVHLSVRNEFFNTIDPQGEFGAVLPSVGKMQ